MAEDDGSTVALPDAYHRDPATYSTVERFLSTIPVERRHEAVHEFVHSLPASTRESLPWAWRRWWARPTQLLPGDPLWQVWDVRAGRGFGKTLSATQGIRELVRDGKAGHVSIIGPTAADVRDVAVEGPTGILAIHPPNSRPSYEPSKRKLTWPNGAEGHLYSAEEPDRLRGPQSDLVWGDEPASWKTGSAAWDNAMMGNRLGRHPRAILTGTPRPLPWLREVESKPTTRVVTGSTYENMGNLAESFIDLLLERYEGTRLGRQELHALFLDDTEGALWTLAIIEATRFTTFDPDNPWPSLSASLLRLGKPMPSGDRRTPWVIEMAVDPPGSTAECGIIVGMAPRGARAGVDHAVILEDASVEGPPEIWGAQVAATQAKWNARKIWVEDNNGGDMVRSTVHNVDSSLPVEKIHARDSKYDRAEPNSVLYYRGWVHHAGHFAKLEDQQTTWVPGAKSPDRMDAAVHLLTKLLRPIAIGSASIATPIGTRLPAHVRR